MDAFKPSNEARIIVPGQLIGAREAARLLGIDRSSLMRRIEAGTVTPLVQLDGPGGAWVFDRTELGGPKP